MKIIYIDSSFKIKSFSKINTTDTMMPAKIDPKLTNPVMKRFYFK